jgi:arabinofuranan 3-O-arabinosyltransferase
VLANDQQHRPDPGAVVLTDGQRLIERSFGRVHDGASETRVPGQPRRLANPTQDYRLPHADRWSTTAFIEGAARVTASSSMSDASSAGTNQPGQMPYAAIDGRVETAWRADYHPDAPAWWQVDFEHPRDVASVRLTAGPVQREVVRVRTEHQRSDVIRLEPGATRSVEVRDDDTGFLRLEDESRRAGNRLALAEVDVPGVVVSRGLQLPTIPRSWGDPGAIVLRAVTDARRGCAVVDRDVRCVVDRDVAGEEEYEFRRRFDLPARRAYRAVVRAQVRPGSALAKAVFAQQPFSVTASSTGSPDPRGSALSAVDGDPHTTWTAAQSDRGPVLGLNWVDPQRVGGLRISLDDDTAAAAPTRLSLRWPGGTRTVTLDDTGAVDFAPIVTRELTLRVLDTERVSGLGFDSTPSSVPVGITELSVTGVPYLPVAVPTAPALRACGSGPDVVVNGVRHQTVVSASFRAMADGLQVAAKLCGSPGITLDAGTNDVTLEASDLVVPRSIVLEDEGVAGSATAVRTSDPRDPVRRTARPSAPGGLLVFHENANPGWTATQRGTPLAPVVVDGWQQAWRTTSRGGDVTTSFAPDLPYRVGVLVGLVLMVLLFVLVVLRRPWGRSGAPPVEARVVPTWVCMALGLLTAGLLAGWIGLGVGVLALALGWAVSRRQATALPWLAAGLVLPPAAAFALRPWAGINGWAGAMAWPAYFVVAAVVLVCGLSLDSRRRRRISFSRRPGFSTKR